MVAPPAALPLPEAPVVNFGGVCGIAITAGDNGSPSDPDPGGAVNLWFDDGTGPVIVDGTTTDLWFAGSFVSDSSGANGDYWVVQTGGGVNYAGDSPPSNIKTCP